MVTCCRIQSAISLERVLMGGSGGVAFRQSRWAETRGLCDRRLRLALFDDPQERVDERRDRTAGRAGVRSRQIASFTGQAGLYGRFCVSASNTSATATIRPASGIAAPAIPT